jgi:hypothetical protein
VDTFERGLTVNFDACMLRDLEVTSLLTWFLSGY